MKKEVATREVSLFYHLKKKEGNLAVLLSDCGREGAGVIIINRLYLKIK